MASNKFKPLLGVEAESILKEEKTQEVLHEKYKKIDKNTTIKVENPFTKAIGNIFTTILVIICIAAVLNALVSFVFPEPREALIDIYTQTFDQIMGFIKK